MEDLGKKKRRKLRIMDMPFTLRPREKLHTLGAKNLTDAELLAILLGTGSKIHNTLLLGSRLLKEFQLRKLEGQIKEMIRYPGVGLAKAARIAAALELGERLYAPTSVLQVTIQKANDVVVEVREFADKRQEHLIVLYLNARHELVLKQAVGIGNLNSLRITPKEIFSHAMQTPCASLIIVHNHPSNDPTPSDDDIHFTKRIHEAGEVMGILLLDHVIVSKGGYFSFREDKTAK